jgi:tetratricopeptide (TPR) repeat protein
VHAAERSRPIKRESAVKVSKSTRKGGRKAQPKKRASRGNPGQEKAIQEFGAAVELLEAGEYARARDRFKSLLQDHSAEFDICDSARARLIICEKRLHPGGPRPRAPREYYDYGIVLHNRKEYGEAVKMFQKAVSDADTCGIAFYGMACALAQGGRIREAIEALGRAIEADPSNRKLALKDDDFDPLLEEPDFEALFKGVQDVPEGTE